MAHHNHYFSPNFYILRLLPILLFFWANIYVSSAQEGPPASPETFQDRLGVTIDLRNPARGNLNPAVSYDFVRDNPDFKGFIPINRNCVTVEAEENRRHTQPEEKVEDFELWMQQEVARSRNLRKKKLDMFTLPVVVHVIYSNPDENISDEQVLSQIEVLNQDYGRTNADKSETLSQFEKLGVDTYIRFCLASVDPFGNPTSGINRVAMGDGPFNDTYINEVIKPNTIWDPERYLNIWVCNIQDGILGYAQFPVSSTITGIPLGATAAQTDGVAIHYQAFGTLGTAQAPFNKGRTATHEIGHFFGLRHIWGDGDCEVDDFVNDTPPTDQPHIECPINPSACTGGPAMFQNFMEYTDDACMNLFTRDQRSRMRTVLEKSPRRRALRFSSACSVKEEDPNRAFVADVRFGCKPLTVTYKNLVAGASSVKWEFPGGKPSSSSDPEPTVTYNSEGLFSVRLITKGDDGKNTIKRDNFIAVANSARPTPFSLDFEAEDVWKNAIFLDNPDDDETWKHNATLGGFGQGKGATYFPNFGNKLVGSKDAIMLPVMDLSNGNQTSLRFDVAYGPNSHENYSDTLGVFITTNCNDAFRAIYYKGGSSLATTERRLAEQFVPLPTEWRLEHIDLSEFDGADFVQITFLNLSGHGNDIYLDNIRVASAEDPAPIPDFTVSEEVVCAGDSITFTDLSAHDPTQWKWSFSGGLPATSNKQNPTVHYATPGIYDVLLETSNESGSETIYKRGVIRVKAGPSLTLRAENEEICPGSSVNIFAEGGDNFRWVMGDSILEFGERIEVSPLATQTYTAVSMADDGCETRESITLYVIENEPLEVDPPTKVICEGEKVALSVKGDAAYSWSPAMGLNLTEGKRVIASPSQTTTYIVTNSDRPGCPQKAQVTVRVVPNPSDFTLTAEKTLLCPGETVSIQAQGNATFTWFPKENLSTDVGPKVVASPELSTTYKVVAQHESGCEASKEIQIEVDQAMDLAVAPEYRVMCAGEPLEITASGADTYSWYPNELTKNFRSSRIEVRPDTTTVFKVVGESQNGCRDSAEAYVKVVKPNPIEVSATDVVLCPGEAAYLSVRGAEEYRWRPGYGLNTDEGSDVEARPRNDIVYTVWARDRQGCVQSEQIQVRLARRGPVRADFSMDESVSCVGQYVQFRERSINGTDFEWFFPGGSPEYSQDPNPQVRYAQTGVYDVRLRVRGCQGEDEVIRRGWVRIENGRPLSFKRDYVVICKGEEATLEANGATTYAWSPAEGLSWTAGSRVVASPNQKTTYLVKGEDNFGCKSEGTVTVDVKGDIDYVDIVASKTELCAGETVSLEVNAPGRYGVQWFPRIGLDDAIRSRVQAAPLDTTIYQVVLTDEQGCRRRGQVQLNVRRSPTVNVFPSKVDICPGSVVRLEAEGATSYQWDPPIDLSARQGKVIEAFPESSTTYYVNGTDAYGCKGEAKVEVGISQGFKLELESEEEIICLGDTISFLVTGGSNYQWSPIDGLLGMEGNRMYASPTKTTTYTVKTGEGIGCNNTASITVAVREPSSVQILPQNTTICEGESVRLTATGANDYEWTLPGDGGNLLGESIRFSPPKTTTVQLSAMDAFGCPVRAATMVEVKPTNYLNISSTAGRICRGEEVRLRAEGAYAYQWISEGTRGMASTNEIVATPEASRTFEVIGKDEFGCIDTARLEVEVEVFSPSFDVSETRIDLAKGPGIVDFYDRTVGANGWYWDFQNGSVSTESNPKHIFTKAGSYPVKLMVTDGVCTDSISRVIVVRNSSDIELLKDRITFSREQRDYVDIQIESPRKMKLKLAITDVEGEVLVTGNLPVQIGTTFQKIDLNGFDPGTYFVVLSDGTDEVKHSVVY